LFNSLFFAHHFHVFIHRLKFSNSASINFTWLYTSTDFHFNFTHFSIKNQLHWARLVISSYYTMIPDWKAFHTVNKDSTLNGLSTTKEMHNTICHMQLLKAMTNKRIGPKCTPWYLILSSNIYTATDLRKWSDTSWRQIQSFDVTLARCSTAN